LDNLLKKLKRDLAASPQKAAALGLMVLVALYFWAPLVLKFTSKGKAKQVAASQVILTDDPLITKVAAHPANDSSRWDRVRLAVAQDHLMTPAAHQAKWRNPFRRSEAVAVQTETEPPVVALQPRARSEAAAMDEVAAKKQLAGVVITAVLTSQRGRSALIRGNVYRVGDVIELGGANGEPKLELLLTSIDEDGVDLDVDGRTIRLERPRAQLAPGSHVKPH
jgi:hypothetical protein